ncbi:uncharacterized protein PAC_16548 [Phialocephala subalpina]|uniref:Uncharacterized protein n=1 Tax=Phialocephala subalpina TaxID=576137 RepID=A0A1L7XNW9_9HELO|nr:uncharacterized protein PAC_16548 [Phialocephala subalpina]
MAEKQLTTHTSPAMAQLQSLVRILPLRNAPGFLVLWWDELIDILPVCCHLGVLNNGGDACGSGNTFGLCGITGTQLWRESCTDQTWESPYCLKLCTTGAGATGDVEITACDDGSYCCGQNNATCCDAGEGLFIVNNQVSLTKSTSSSSSSSSTSTSSSSSSTNLPSSSSSSTTSTTTLPATVSTVTNSSSPSPSPSSTNSGLSTGAKAGIAVGAVLGALAIAGAVLFLRKKKKAGGPEAEPPYTYGSMLDPNAVRAEHPSEMDATWRTQEMDSGYRGQEVPGKAVPVQHYSEMPT